MSTPSFEPEVVQELQELGQSLAVLPRSMTVHAVNDALRPYQFGKGVWAQAKIVMFEAIKLERERLQAERSGS